MISGLEHTQQAQLHFPSKRSSYIHFASGRIDPQLKSRWVPRSGWYPWPANCRPSAQNWRSGLQATMSTSLNYSLWLMPDKRVSDLVKQEIAKESEAYGGPSFEPHITLLPDIKGDIDQIKQTSQDLVGCMKVSSFLARQSCGYCTPSLTILPQQLCLGSSCYITRQ
jgi:hypothetical protein